MTEEDAIYEASLPYLVGITVATDTPGPTGDWVDGLRRFALSGSVFEFHGRWVLATAGHCINDLNAIVRHDGQLSVAVVDGWAGGGGQLQPIPLHYDPDLAFAYDDNKWDFGFIILPDNTRALLEAGRVKTVGPDHYSSEPSDDKYQVCAVLGLPTSAQNARVKGDAVALEVSPVLARLEHAFEVPAEVKKADVPLWYGRLKNEMAAEIGSLDGMSGGTVFGFRRLNSEKIHLQVIGIQYAIKRHGQYIYVMATPWYMVNKLLEELRARIQDAEAPEQVKAEDGDKL